ncbi:MAG TPA: bifunctional ornithine acetyltransferase/N-acetylglutamate synthase [Candidatus Coprocola pullicola]|nr:bifunctional ornithine acetyltransferase/N-acetylglutamate synthase [Candidatus Coprocola pullicola]
MRIIEGGITAPKGFLAAGAHIGIKKVKKDLSLLYSQKPSVAAGMFTQNIVRAAPVIRNEKMIKAGNKIKGIVTISGNANACTGRQGLLDNEKMAEIYAQMLHVKQQEILTAATGIIGKEMPMKTIEKGIRSITPNINASRQSAKDAAEGIITTDTFLKELAVELDIGGKVVTIGAMAKGSGMIHPNMATVLAFLTTDAVISQRLLQKALIEAVKVTYNMISVDGSVSTNDMALFLANGMAENEEFTEDSQEYQQFLEAVLYINKKLAVQVVQDGEGASKMMATVVTGAKTKEDAGILAKAVINDNLVKTAIYGEDANWGRILAAMGGSGGFFNPEGVAISFANEKGVIHLMSEGQPIAFDENKALEILAQRDIIINIVLQDGLEEAMAWGCDLGHEYIRINGEYRLKT